MTSENTTADLKEGRAWLQRAASVLSGGEDSAAVEFASAAAAIGSGFVALAHAEVSQVRQAILSLSDEPTLAEAAQQREERTATEARPGTSANAAASQVQAASEARPHDGHAPCVEHDGVHCDGCEQPWPCDAVRPRGEPKGEAAHWLEGDDEIFTESGRG